MSEQELMTAIRAYLQAQLPCYLEMLHRMVAINSFTANPTGVNELGELTAELFAGLGFAAEFVPSVDPTFGKHVVLTRNGRTDKTIGMVSHLDTVFPAEEEKRNNFHWRVEGDRIYGPGTVDIKGGTVMMYMVLDALRKFSPDAFADANWVLLLDSSEEVLADDFGELCVARLQDALACLIFEGGSFNHNHCKIVVARKGMAVCCIQVEGKAAHAGSAHHRGANAVVQMSSMIAELSGLTDYEKQVTVNVGSVAGGTVPNRVPHRAEAVLEMRAFDEDYFEEALERITAVAENTTLSNRKGTFTCRSEMTLLQRTAPWPRNEGTDGLFAIWQSAGEALGYGVIEEHRGGLSDGNNTWHAVPTLDGLGPAGGNAHCSERSDDGSKDQEYCYVPSFVPKAMLNIVGILQLLNDTDPKGLP